MTSGAMIQFKGGQLNVPDHPAVPFIEGDGIGPDIWRAASQVIDHAVQACWQGNRRIAWKEVLAGEKAYQEIGEYWDRHDLTEVWEQTEPAEFEVDIQSEQVYYRLDRELSSQIVILAHTCGISAETLLNLWIQEKLQQALSKNHS